MSTVVFWIVTSYSLSDDNHLQDYTVSQHKRPQLKLTYVILLPLVTAYENSDQTECSMFDLKADEAISPRLSEHSPGEHGLS
jgi:hypothetical protein